MAKIFISYAHADASYAAKIADALSDAGLEPWIDQRMIVSGDSFLAKMNEGLEDASYFVLLVSSASLQSHWVTREWLATLARKSTVILPLLLERCEMPALLRDIVYIDATNRSEGLSRLMDFFRRELTVVPQEGHGSSPTFRSGKVRLTPREIRIVANMCLDDGALDAFLIDAEINPGQIGGHSLNERVNNLLHRVRADGTIQSFADWLAMEAARCFEYQLSRVRSAGQWTLKTDTE